MGGQRRAGRSFCAGSPQVKLAAALMSPDPLCRVTLREGEWTGGDRLSGGHRY